MTYARVVPKLWDETIETHRQAVRDAIVDAAGALVIERGLRGVTMSALAERAGVGRATLYKYFPDVESALTAWHEAQVMEHADELVRIRDRAGTAVERLEAVLTAYAAIQHEHPEDALVAHLHGGAHVDRARDRLEALVAELIEDGAANGDIRLDVPAGELAQFALHALAVAGALHSKAAVRRLVGITLDGLRPRN